MLPTKGYFQDIECPYYDDQCGRPYCHYRHRRKPQDDLVDESALSNSNPIPTYKPTPKSELANNRSHIPISYVPDLSFSRKERFNKPAVPTYSLTEKPTYKPTPISLLTSVNKESAKESLADTVNDIKQILLNDEYHPGEGDSSNYSYKPSILNDSDVLRNLADNEYNPSGKTETGIEYSPTSLEKSIHNSSEIEYKPVSETKTDFSYTPSAVTSDSNIDFEELSSEFNLIDEILNDSSKPDDQKNEKNASHHKAKTKPESKSKSDHKSSKSKDKEKPSSKDSKHRRSSSSSSKHDKKSKSHEKSKDDSKKKEETKKSRSSDKEKHSSSGEKRSDHKSRHKSEKKDKDKSRESKKKDEKHQSKSDSHKSSSDSHKSSSKSSKDDKKKSKSSSKSKETKTDKSKSNENPKSKYELSDDSLQENDIFDNDFVADSREDLFMDMDDDETMQECYKIFNEYKPEIKSNPIPLDEDTLKTDSILDDSLDIAGKKRVAHANSSNYTSKIQHVKPKTGLNAAQIMANRFKLAKAMQAENEGLNIMNEVKQYPNTAKRPAPKPLPSLLEAAKKHKVHILNSQQKPAPSVSIVDDIINGKARVAPKRIAPVQNVFNIQRAKAQFEDIKKRAAVEALKTPAQIVKGVKRQAHVPEFSLSDIPDVIDADKSKLPVNVRTRFLTMLADETSKLYLSKEDAFKRALNEEHACYQKCKVLATYRNSTMLAVNRLRKEVQERDNKGLGLMDTEEANCKKSDGNLEGHKFYEKIQQYVLTDEELDIHGYPKESTVPGRAVIKNKKPSIVQLPKNQRKCCRCSKIYLVDEDGFVIYEEECVYHPLKKRTFRGEQKYLCCRSNDDSGCATSNTHVSETQDSGELEGFQSTMEPERSDDPRSHTVYALDCEMCYTTKGLELTRVTIVDTNCKTVYESLVKPLNPIIDYNTKFSGITKEQMNKVSTGILQVQANILHLCNSKTILIGHSLESDMKALKIVHGSIVDTAVMFPHKMGLPHKRALRMLASDYLRKIIQNDVGGHDSAEDAITCMELIHWRLKEDLKGGRAK